MAASWSDAELRRLDVDEVWRSLGWCGPYQMLQTLYIAVTAGVTFAFPILSVVFEGASNDQTCLPRTQIVHGPEGEPNITVKMEGCRVLVYDNQSGEIEKEISDCRGYSYREPRHISFVSDFDLVCERAPLAQLSQTLVMAGMLSGATCLSPLADKLGRKTLHVGCQALLFAVSLAMAFMPNYAIFAAMKYLSGLFMMGMCVPMVIILLETYPTEKRALMNQVFSQTWCISIIIMTLIAYLTCHYGWRTMQIVMAAFHGLSFLQIFLLDETLVWLVANGKFANVRRVLMKAARLNQKDLDAVIRKSLEKGNQIEKTIIVNEAPVDNLALLGFPDGDHSDTEKLRGQADEAQKTVKIEAAKKERTVDIFRDPDMRCTMLSLMFVWVTCAATYYGLTLLSFTLAGDIYVNFFLGALLEMVSNVFLWLSLSKLGRKRTVILFTTIAWVSLLAASLVAALGGDIAASNAARTALSLAGRFGISGTCSGVWIYTPELLPTNLRNIGTGFGSASARVGGMAAPFFKFVSDKAIWAPGAVFSALCLLSTLLLLRIPETKHRALPLTIDDIKAWRREDREDRDKKKKEKKEQAAVTSSLA